MARFRAKARAVELLGKGQIADLPTAISELWKNGYDAYAKNLECKLFLDSYKDNTSPIFLLSDDGFGMSETDILNKWFVLGTDSKARNEKIQSEFGLDKRTPMGEKGIGRLSVSYLGSQMLMLSKKIGEEANAFLMDWRVLENYDFFLEDLNIPLFKFDKQKSFDTNFTQAKNEFILNLDEKLWEEQLKFRNSILTDWKSFEIPRFINSEVIEKFCETEFHGTCFVIFTPNDQLLELSDKDHVAFKNSSALNYLRSSLSGLHNDLKTPEKDFNINFLIFDASGKYDLIDAFLTQDEMRNADHWLKGEFDKNGFFTGEIKIFNKREKYTFRPNRPPGETTYGPFNIEWGALEGNRNSSLLNDEEYTNIENKLNSFGGLYIYRDDFRVLPYGRTEADFLKFEQRRSLSAGQYFFSHRRFIGYIDLKREQNSFLKDKAGREGFIENKAFREFKEDLIEFFIDIARRYMRSGKDEKFGTFRESQLAEIEEKHNKQLEAAKRKNKKTKTAFLSQLKENEDRLVQLQNEIEELSTQLQTEVSQIEINYNSYNSILERLENKKSELRSIKVQKPQGVSVNNRQEAAYTAYQQSYYAADAKMQSCYQLVDKTRERINVENLKLEYNEKYRSHLKYIEKQFSSFQLTSKEAFARINKLLEEEKELQVEAFREQSKPHTLMVDDSKQDISLKISALENLIGEQKKLMENSFEGFINHITNLQIDVDDDFLRGWYQEQNETLNEKLRDYEELAQLGMSIEIIDHQFNVMYSQMNDAVKELAQYNSEDGALESSVTQLKNAFQHLEVNYKLLRPLYRTSRRSREVISGEQINQYIASFFKNEFERYQIKFGVNEKFKTYEFFTFDSIIKPVFINIINNANYWLIPAEKREIRIELIDDEILIMNSGARIDDSQLEDIFLLFFTRKKEGRGIGLYLAKKHLNSIGYELRATNEPKYNKLNGACFVISKNNKQ